MAIATKRDPSDALNRWVPEGAVIDIVSRRERGTPEAWTAQIPAFRIEARGQTRGDAVARAQEQLLSYLAQAESEGKSYEEAAAARKTALQAIGLLFVLALAIKVFNRDATWWRLPGEMLVGEGLDAARETTEILQDEHTMAALRESDEDLAAGRVRPYENVRRDLGLG